MREANRGCHVLALACGDVVEQNTADLWTGEVRHDKTRHPRFLLGQGSGIQRDDPVDPPGVVEHGKLETQRFQSRTQPVLHDEGELAAIRGGIQGVQLEAEPAGLWFFLRIGLLHG